MVSYTWKGESFKKFLKSREVSVKNAADKLGVTRQTVYQYFDSERLTKEVVDKILSTFNVKESEIFEAEFVHAVSDTEKSHYGNAGRINDFIDLKNGNVLMITPLIEEYAQAGFLSGYKDPEYMEELPSHSIVVDKFHKGNYFSFRVIGESMDDGTSQSILHGSIVTAREINKNHWKSKFHTHKFADYVIVHKDGILVKRIIAHDTERGTIMLRSLNPDKEYYPDYEVNLDECEMILNIVNVSVSR